MRATPEDTLLTRLQAGEDGALVEMAETYGVNIHQLAYRYLRSWEDAEEVAQDVLLTVHRKIHEFRGDAALASWIYRITVNKAMSRLRTARSRRAQDEERRPRIADGNETDAGTPDVPDWSALADEHVLRSQFRRSVKSAILALPEIYRAPVVLRDLQGLSTEEASAALQVNDQALKSRLHRGRVLLRQQLADFGTGLNLHQTFGMSRN